MPPTYDLNKIKFATDEATFQRAVELYERGKVTEVEEAFGDFTAVVQGTQAYRVSVAGCNFKHGHCTCYLGEKGALCKHMVALAIHAVLNGKTLTSEDKQQRNEVKCSDRRETLSDDEFAAVKASIAEAMKYIKPYRGPSRTWFANQDSLQEGCARLSAIVSELPVNRQTADILVKLLLRLDRKLQVGGVDDSNGIVGGFMNDVVAMLKDFTQMDPSCIDAFESLCGKQTCFGWEEPLVRIFDDRNIQ
jgi:hypothetical protein